MLDRTISKVLEWGFILYKVRDMIISNIKRNIEKKERCGNGNKKVRLPLWPKNEKESQWKNIEENYAQYFDGGSCVLRYYGAFHAVSCEQYFAGQPAAHG